jgi:predicted MPP superfamily phosphohydrolase
MFVGAVVLPAETLRRHVRRLPTGMHEETTETLDVADKLGYKPVGRGKYHFMASLPGNDVFRVDFTTLALRPPGLPPAWDGLTILQLSDFHFGGTPDRPFYRQVIDRCLADGVPDVLVVTGDVIDSDTHHRWILPLLGRLRAGVAAFAILGNHDYWHDHARVRRRLRRAGFDLPGNGWCRRTVRGEGLTVIGHEGPWFRPAPDLRDCPRDDFRLLLSHTPDNLAWARRNDVRLMLSGHCHGGQVRLPLFGSVFVPSRYGRRFDGGTYFESPTLLHVTRGLAGREPLRYNCRPQVSRIVLRS